MNKHISSKQVKRDILIRELRAALNTVRIQEGSGQRIGLSDVLHLPVIR